LRLFGLFLQLLEVEEAEIAEGEGFGEFLNDGDILVVMLS